MTASRSTIAVLRFGSGFRPGESAPEGPDDLMRELDAPLDALLDEAEARERAAAFFEMNEVRKRIRKGDAAAEEERQALAKRDRRRLHRDGMIRLARAVTTREGFRERLTRFWSDHFAVARKNPQHSALILPMQELAIRPNLGGRFADMLRAAALSPAMTFYLDQQASAGPNSKLARTRKDRGLNENLAREILELHTLGVDGPYAQDDVREFARVLAGHGFGPDGPRFRPQFAEPGAKTVLGARYDGVDPGAAPDVLDRLAAHPATARHLARKMATHFVSDAPSDAMVEAMATAYLDGGGDLGAMTRAMLERAESWRPLGEPDGKVKKPWDLVVSAVRAAGPRRGDLGGDGAIPAKLLIGGLKDMGQPLDKPPGPDGWKEEAAAWITPGGMAARIAWAARVGRLLERRLDPRAYAETALRDALGRETGFAVRAASEKWEAFALLIVSPDFNRR